MSRPPGTAAELERRRRRAVQLYRQGERPADITRLLGLHRSSLYRWLAAVAQRPGGLAAKPHPGPTPRLADDQLRQLEGLLDQGAQAHGWPNPLWTADRVRRFLRTRLGWTSQKPQRKARERDEDEIACWLRAQFPRLVRQTKERG